ncbi:DUF4979 domain-containing protein [Autumnicola psychrophila]|uniref:DUF4979 domain-containing protein n=1 Tax=Autumnicola psychrophila TaxID=3075592 RepID=A0ABU3DM16_9FLAO|nr:DUF4979 domain-containing protein [Zunongwangia sp. F225]MDT0684745.1 DUF4979 domain-containing protein [Zunongwangia sp. F225]
MKTYKFRIKDFLPVSIVLLIILGACENEELTQYTYPAPKVESFSPTQARISEEISISGADFGYYPDAVTVFFGEAEGEVVSVEDTEIITKVPVGASSGVIRIKVWTNTDSTSTEFTLMPSAKIDRIAPSTAVPGETVTIYGENFELENESVSVFFGGNIEGQVVSRTNTEIQVIVPEGGMSGPINVNIGTQSLSSQAFSYPLIGLDYEFEQDGNAEGWVATHNSSYEVSGGSFNVQFDDSQFGAGSKRRADLKLEEGASIQVGSFPILAIRINKPSSGNFILDTNFGSYKGGSNNWEGVIQGDIYYYDLRNTFGSDNNLPLNEVTDFTTLQFKIADITTDEEGYSVEWVKSFESLEALENYAELPPGKLIYEFDDPNPENYWVGLQNATNVIEDGKLKVSFDASQFEGTNKRRADLKYVEGGTFPLGEPTGIWRYSPDFPILAIKMSFTGTGAPEPGTGNIKLDRFMGAVNNAYLTDFVGQNVIYYDLAVEGGFTEAQELASFQLKIADITSAEETGYEIDWIRTFSSVEELDDFLD